MERKLTCIICPRGCALTAKIGEGGVEVSGNGCKRGVDYAVNECTHPMRTVTASVRIANRYNTMVSVKTAAPIPKEKMLDVMALIHGVRLDAPVKLGQCVIADAFGSEIIATKAVD